MSERQTFAKAMRMAESGTQRGEYGRVRGLVRGTARLLGAYGIPSDEWERLAREAGYPGANWQDAKAQDAVANATFNHLYNKYKDWRLVAVAWKAGEAAADRVAADPKLLDNEGLVGLKAFVEQVMSSASEDLEVNQPVMPDGTPVNPQAFKTGIDGMQPRDDMGVAPAANDATQSVTRLLVGMRDRQREFDSRKSTEETEEVSDDGSPS